MAKKGEKTMIGDNGWLERTDKVPDKTKKTPQKKVGIIEGIKKIAKDMVRVPQVSNKRRLTHENRRSYITTTVDLSTQSRNDPVFRWLSLSILGSRAYSIASLSTT